jgi:hypothetical protein
MSQNARFQGGFSKHVSGYVLLVEIAVTVQIWKKEVISEKQI